MNKTTGRRGARPSNGQVPGKQRTHYSTKEYMPANSTEYSKAYYAKNRERRREHNRLYYVANRDRLRMEAKVRYRENHDDHGTRVRLNKLRSTLRKHGLTEEQYVDMCESQGDVCAICGKECQDCSRLSIDHDHVSGEVRGLLCKRCNSGLGLFGDSPDVLIRAANYLTREDKK